MGVIKKIGSIVIGVAIGTVVQFFSGVLTVFLRIPDPALSVFYSSIGILLCIGIGLYLFSKKKWFLASGFIISVPFWWVFFFLSMAVTGNWL